MMKISNQLLCTFSFILSFGSSVALRVIFAGCQSEGWNCLNNVPNDIKYTCVGRNNEIAIHLKDFYTDHITSLTIENCRDVKVVVDCPQIKRTSQLQRFVVRNVDRLEFTTTSKSSNAITQTPPEVVIENVNEIVSLPRKLFKPPSSSNERKCSGPILARRIRISNSKVNTIKTNAFCNVTGFKSIELENVTISDIQAQGIDAIMGGDDTVFKIVDSTIDNIETKGISVQSATVSLSDNEFGVVASNSINFTSDYVKIVGNRFKQINSHGLTLKSINTDIIRNRIHSLKSNAFDSIKCARRGRSKKQFNFNQNTIDNLEPYSLVFDYDSCKTAGALVTFNNNKIDCRCQNIAFLNSINTDLSNSILNTSSNNTCLSAPCTLPVDIVKILLESDMCQLNLDPQVMCLLYSDKHAEPNEEIVDDDVTEPAPTFYLIRQANSRNGIAEMSALNKDDLLRDGRLNMTNRTAIKVVFNSSLDFVETLRSTNRTRMQEPKVQPRDEYVNRCVGPHCRNNVAYDRQKALDFYKYVYAQLRPPRQNDNKKKT